MAHRLVIDGNAVYEIDQDCVRRNRERQDTREAGYGGKTGNYGQARKDTRYGRGR